MSDPTPAKDNHGLTAVQKRFADAWAEAKMAGADFTDGQLAEAAGYRGNKDVLAVAASRTLANPKVRDYLHERAKAYLKEGAVAVAVTLRTLSTRARSERVRADTAARLATGLGLIAPEQVAGQTGVAVQIVFRSDAGALLVQSEQARPDAQAIRGVQAIDHGIAEGEDGGRQARPQISRAKATARQRKAPRGGGGGDFGERGKEEGGVPSPLPPEKSGGGKGGAAKISRVVKSRGGA